MTNQENIKDVTKQLLLKTGYNEITISEISKLTQIKRGMIYNYYKNKEDIFLDVLSDELSLFVNAIDQASTNSVEELIYVCVSEITDNQLLLELISILNLIIEPQASLDALIAFKTNYIQQITKFTTTTAQVLNDKSMDFIIDLIINVSGVYSMTKYSDKQLTAIKTLNMQVPKIEIKTTVIDKMNKLYLQ